jgi:hypothetical protein
MKDKIFLYTMLTMIALLGCLGMAAAQDPKSQPPMPPVENDGKISAGANVSSTAPPPVIGWNYVHATVCQGYWDGTTYWLYVYPPEGGFWATSNLTFQITIAPACQTGYWLAFHIYDLLGSWDRVQTYTYK